MTKLNDQRIEIIIGQMLRAGVILSSAFVLGGGVWYLFRKGSGKPAYGAFHGVPPELRTFAGIMRGVAALDPQCWIQLGLLVLIATPVARVLFSIFAFAEERDWAYVGITLLVAGILLFSLFGGR